MAAFSEFLTMGYFTSKNTPAFARFSFSYFFFVNSAEDQLALLLKLSKPENKGYLKLLLPDACFYQETFVYERLSTSLELMLSSIHSSLVRNNQLGKLSSLSS